jgi:hypothetical protein
MSDAEMNKKMEFIVEHQAKFAADIEIMREVQAADAKRLGDGLNGVIDIVGHLAQAQMITDDNVKSLTQEVDRLTERLNIFINVVERFISGNGGAESSA